MTGTAWISCLYTVFNVQRDQTQHFISHFNVVMFIYLLLFFSLEDCLYYGISLYWYNSVSFAWLLTPWTVGLVLNAFWPFPLHGSTEGGHFPPLLLSSVAQCTPLYFPSRKNHTEVKWAAEGEQQGKEGWCTRKTRGNNAGIIPSCAIVSTTVHCILLYHPG